LGVPPVWLSLVLTPIASEMEEKVSAIRLATSHAEGGSLAIVSFIGSKIENATVLLALIGIFTDFDLHPALPEVISALIANVIGVVTLLDGKLGAKESVMLIVLYFAMIYFSFLYY
ncbi:MAG: sodium:calcium antiporter, partial [Candidatus Aramenus sp.]|nr:sodium:calcium antiporter [Candidatus Aramenus sp.]